MVNTLIIEDNKNKLEAAAKCLKKVKIDDYSHIDSHAEAMALTMRRNEKHAEDFRLILLDMIFYKYPDKDSRFRETMSSAGCDFLVRLARRYQREKISSEKKPCIIVYSTIEDWKKNLEWQFLPSFSKYKCALNSSFSLSMEDDELKKNYDQMIQKNKNLIDSIDFVFGHAHNSYELQSLLNLWYLG